jgi:hypothetical protein
MELTKISSEISELSFEEAISINGGESLWYWVAYGVGAVASGLAAMAQGANSTVGQGYPPR